MKSFDAQICQGIVIHYMNLPLVTEIKNKFLLVLNRDCNQPNIYCFLTTSQMRFYCGKLKKEFVFIPKNAVTFFRRVTLVDCRERYRLDRETLKKKYESKEAIFKGILPEPFMKAVFETVRHSKLITRRIKKLILP